ncbi:unnamed protein product [Rotaria magnacalcarata]|uniref:guanylate cyclase n=1 Tax=Rotaria magnacalcarata TaxID=392030 RepID=A0A814JH52_9BILA|nr:unnamed protein product [Rotaria magnacalcarata]CAF3837543.1 unnamed protein product [Rotaria magnacalcarata]CAF3960266.1 unnamed protein product [Rotaria magnacalcarata]
MYGLLLQSAVEIIQAKYGQETWDEIKTILRIDTNSFSAFHQYGETLFTRIANLLSELKHEPISDIMDIFGFEFVSYVSNNGYDQILRILGHNMRDFLNGLDNLHEYMRYSYPRMRPPSFYVEKESAEGLTLHYRSRRRGFVHYVIGQITEIGRRYYDSHVEIEIISEREELDVTHIVLELRFENIAYIKQAIDNKDIQELALALDSETFLELFPFHMVISESLKIISAGSSLSHLFPNITGELLRDIFHLVRPIITLNWSQIILHSNNVFEFTTIEPLHKQILTQIKDDDSDILLKMPSHQDINDTYLKMRGQMLYLHEWKAIVYLATPILENLDVMINTGLFINDLSMHDSSRDLVLAGTQQSAELKLALDQEKQKSKALEESMKKLDSEMRRTDLLLYQMIPKKIADRLRNGEKTANLCETFESCTILFSDVVGFTSICALLTPMEVVSILNEMYTKFDKCLENHNCYKVETIGDAYMLVSGLPERARNHAAEIIDMAFDMLDAIITVSNPTSNERLKIRIGCHSGPVVAGIAGIKMPRYCLFGDTVTQANIIEQTSKALHIHISDSTYKLLDRKSYEFEERARATINGSLPSNTFFVLKKKDRSGNIQIRPFHQAYEQMKRQEIEEAKRTQAMMIKNINKRDPTPYPLKSNGVTLSSVSTNALPRSTGSAELIISTKANSDSSINENRRFTNVSGDSQPLKIFDPVTGKHEPKLPIQGRLRNFKSTTMTNNSHPVQNERIKRRHFVVLGLLFLISIASLLMVYILFPNIDPEEKHAFKIPKTIDDAKILGNVLYKYSKHHRYIIMTAFFMSYIFLQTFAIPGSIFLSILAGFLYPFPLALFLVCLCSSLGATFCYLLSKLFGRHILLKYFRKKIVDWQLKVQKRADSLLWFIIFLRITPILPNWFINVCSPILDVPLKPFFFGTFGGVALPSILFIQAGKTLHQLSSPSDVFSWGSILMLALCASLSLLPIYFKNNIEKFFKKQS